MKAVYLKDPELTLIFKAEPLEDGTIIVDGSHCDRGELKRQTFDRLGYESWVEEQKLQAMEEQQYDRLSQIYNFTEA